MAQRQTRSLEISELLSKDLKDTPLKEVLTALEVRNQYQKSLEKALELTGFSHFIPEISIGEVSENGAIRLLASHASVISRVKNKLPSILHALRQSGCKVNEIQLKTSPSINSNRKKSHLPSETIAPLVMTPAQIQSWENVLKSSSPESSTYQAIERLLIHAKKSAKS